MGIPHQSHNNQQKGHNVMTGINTLF